MAKSELIAYICPKSHMFTVEYTGWRQTIPCSKKNCKESARMAELINDISNLEISFKRYSKEPVAFWKDPKTGKEFATDAKGKIMDPSETRYDTNRDPRGWKATGKKVREKDSHGRLNR